MLESAQTIGIPQEIDPHITTSIISMWSLPKITDLCITSHLGQVLPEFTKTESLGSVGKVHQVDSRQLAADQLAVEG